MVQYSALRCVSDIWQNNEKPLISNGLRFIVTCLPTAALWVLFHLARHTFCSLQLEAGTDSRTVQELVGHKNLATTQRYLDSVDRRKKEAANRITLKRKTE